MLIVSKTHASQNYLPSKINILTAILDISISYRYLHDEFICVLIQVYRVHTGHA